MIKAKNRVAVFDIFFEEVKGFVYPDEEIEIDTLYDDYVCIYFTYQGNRILGYIRYEQLKNGFIGG